MFENNILLAEGFLSYVLDKKKKKKKKKNIFQQRSRFIYLFILFNFFLFYFILFSRISSKMGSKMDIPIPQIRSKQRHRNKHDGRKNA